MKVRSMVLALILGFAALFFLLGQAYAQPENRPLYNSQRSGASSLYNSGARARPLSLKQMLNRPSSSSAAPARSTASVPNYRPFRQNNAVTGFSGSASGMTDIQAFRAQQAARARAIEEQARTSFLAYNSPNEDMNRDERTQSYRDRFQSTSPSTSGQTPRRVYRQRNEDSLQAPRRLFNSIR